MKQPSLSVREILKPDIELIIQYWGNAKPAFLQGMGVDLSKMPTSDEWRELLSRQLGSDYPDKKSYCIVWLLENAPIGHCNINKIIFGEEAYMHLHIWDENARNSGYGSSFVKLSLPYFFKNIRLQKLLCEPYSLNPAPNKALERLGFRFVREYTTTPGFLNFEQPVKRWELTKETYQKLYS